MREFSQDQLYSNYYLKKKKIYYNCQEPNSAEK